MAHRSSRQALQRTRRRFEVRATIPLQQPYSDLRKIQRHLPQENEAERRRRHPAAFRRGGKRNRGGARQGTFQGRSSGSRSGNWQSLSHDLHAARKRTGKSREAVRGVSPSQATGRGTHGKTVALQLQSVRAEENQGIAKTEKLQGRGIRRRDRARPGQAKGPGEVLSR